MQETTREDVRVRRSRTLLVQALTSLLTEKTFDEIRVKDICQRAGVHRSTFYAHFEDKIHLLTYGIQELMDSLILLPSDDPDQFQHAIYRIFKFFKLNETEYSLLFLNPQNAAARQLFQDEFARVLRRALRQRLPQLSLTYLTDSTLFFTGGLFSVIVRWLQEGATVSPHEMAQRFVRVFPGSFTAVPFHPENETDVL